MDVINIGTNDDGTPRLHYHAPGEHVVIVNAAATGPIKLADGTEYDLTPNVIAVGSEEHAQEIVAAINAQQATEAVPAVESSPPIDDAPTITPTED